MTKKEDIWVCSECGQEHGRHDLWFEGICEKCNLKQLNAEEKLKITNFINDFKKEMYLHKVSGGFVIIEETIVSDSEIEIYLKYGTQDENGDYSSKITITLDRETFKETEL